MTRYHSHIITPLGKVLVVSEHDALIGLLFEEQKHYLSTFKEIGKKDNHSSLFKHVENFLEIYFNGEKSIFQWNMKPIGTIYQKQVWQILSNIEYGKTTTYQSIAQRVAILNGRTTFSARAVGTAIGKNPISIIIPCHRVIGSDGKLRGYNGGLERKQYLLKLEKK